MGGQTQKGLCSAREVVPRPHIQRGATVLNTALYALNTTLQGGDKVSAAEQHRLQPLHPLPAHHPPGMLAMGGPVPSLHPISETHQ